MLNATITTEKMVMDAYSEEMYRWGKKVKYIENTISEVMNKIYDIEDANKSGFLGKIKNKFGNKSETIDRLNEMLDILEKKRNELEKYRPDEIAYRLGAIQNTLFYINIGNLKGGL